MIVLGISALDKDSHATLMSDDRILAAVGEERLTRVKMQAGFPHQAILECLRIAGVSLREVDVVAYPFWDWTREAEAIMARAKTEIPSIGMEHLSRCHDLLKAAIARGPATTGIALDADGYEEYMDKPWSRKKLYEVSAGTLAGDIATDKALATQWVADAIRQHKRDTDELETSLERLGLKDRLHRVEHHVAHQANAFYGSGYERALVVTIDAYGSGLSGSIAVGNIETGVQRVTAFDFPHSLGFFYEHLTSALGFKPSRHEGKILGLAAYGDPSILHDVVASRFRVENGNFKYFGANNYFFPRYLSLHFRKKDIAAAYQRVLEEVCTQIVAYHLKNTGETNVVLSGGVTANVKLNQRIAEVPGVKSIWVHPAMGDAGTGTGAAMHVLREKLGARFRPERLHDAYLGLGYSHEEVTRALEANNLKWREPANFAEEVAKLIYAGKVVARFDGRMEYGPRALGNRSVMYHAREPQVNKWLNKQLARTEFMPFAPVTMWEDRHRYYKNIDVSEPAANFMTITVDCTEEMTRNCPAAVHVDDTARPQLVKREVNQGYYDILAEYKKLSGHGTLINTSFNMHEEPIVCSPEDAIRAFRLGHLDYLAIGRCLVENPEPVDRSKK